LSANDHPPAAIPLTLSLDSFRRLIQAVVAEVLAQVEAVRAQVPNGQLAYSEEEAARLLGLEPHVLRDERRRGRISGSSIVGRRIRYTRQDLIDYLAGRRIVAEGDSGCRRQQGTGRR
jgi:hypothetical protein